MQWRGSGNNSEWRSCNQQPCHNEPCLIGQRLLSFRSSLQLILFNPLSFFSSCPPRSSSSPSSHTHTLLISLTLSFSLSPLIIHYTGIRNVGCYRLPPQGTLNFLEKTNLLLEDNPYNRTEPVRKCGQVAGDRGYEYFGVALGLCFSGPHPLSRFQSAGNSTLCQNGTGNYFGYFAIDVYHIMDRSAFLSTAQSAERCGMNFCDNSTSTNSTNLCSGASSSSAIASYISIALVTIVTMFLFL